LQHRNRCASFLLMKINLQTYIIGLLACTLLLASPGRAQNLALGKAAFASSTPVQAAANAFDGNLNTRWESPSSDLQYLIIDLGSVQSIDRIRLNWETALGKDFTLDISAVTVAPSDANWTNVVAGSWTAVETITGNTATTNDYPHLGRSGRYVRLNATARGTGYGYSLFEFAVYPYDPNPNLALGKPVTTSSAPLQAAGNAVDGNGTTRWESPYTDPQVLTVDLGTVQPIDRIRLTWESALGKDFTVEVSRDGTQWETAVTETGNTSTSNEYANLGKSGQYVRLTGTARSTTYGYSLYELEVFAASTNQPNLAAGKHATASSTQGTLEASYAFDNDRLTRWGSTAGREDASIYVDLQGQATLSRVYLVWEKAYGGDFTIDVSPDAVTWTKVSMVVDNSFHFNEFVFTTPVTGRYVRLNGTKRGTTIADNGYSLYEFEVNGTLQQPLPVTLTSFSAALQGPAVAVSWATASEQNSAGFEVQRAAAAMVFATLARVAGAGTTSHPQAYHYIDTAPLPTTAYYRLKQVDNDGASTYSPVVVVQATPKATSPLAIRSYPNPTPDRATVTWATPLTTPGHWYLTNMLGQLVHAELLNSEATTSLSLDLQNYAAGTYILTVEAGSQLVGRSRIQKTN
jgi:hypothetical protein